MCPGSLTMVCLLLVPGQAPAGVNYVNTRVLKIPIVVEPARQRDIRELVLYVSANQGRSWERVGAASPDKSFIRFDASGDGEYWFRIAAINLQGKQEPENLYLGAPDQKIRIDTVHKPVLRIASAQRRGDELAVAWEARTELPPDEKSLQLEYRTLDSASSVWLPIALTPGPNGEARTRLLGLAPVAVRMQFRDLAGNVARAETTVPGADGSTKAVNTSAAAQRALPLPTPSGTPAPAQRELQPQLPSIPTPRITDPSGVALMNGGGPAVPGPGPLPAPPSTSASGKPITAAYGAAPVAVERPPIVATSQQEVSPVVPPPGPAPSPASARGLPPLQLVNEREVNVEYELSRVGPSGIGHVALYLTRDRGEHWELFADDPDAGASTAGGKYQRILELPEGDGVYGLTLVVRNRAGIGKAPPRGGDAPEMLLEVDQTPPYAELRKPVADPQHREALLLSWTAQDKNLPAQPITLEWAKERDGPWERIKADLPPSGQHSWHVPAGTPVRVYLRLRVHDSAGNEATAITPEPQLVDLTEPEGRLLTIKPAKRK